MQLDTSDWTPIPGEPMDEDEQLEVNQSYDASLAGKVEEYIQNNNLTPAQAANLKAAAAGGKVTSDIAAAFNEVSKAAAVETQAKFGLSSTWFRGTTFVESWIPVNAGAINPTSVNGARLDFLLGNLDKIGDDLQKAGQTLLDGMPDGPNKVALSEFLKIIGDAIKDLKANLRSLNRADALNSERVTKGKLAALSDKRLRMEEQSEMTEKSLKKEMETKASGQSMKVVGPIIAAFMTLLGALIAIFTLGIASEVSVAIIIVGVAVGIAMTLYSAVDSATDCSAKIGKAMNEAIEKSLKNAPAWAKSLVKALIISAMIAVLIVMMVASGGGGSGSLSAAAETMATQTTTQVVQQTIKEIIKQLALQVIVMSIMCSNIVPELVGNVLKAAGVKSDVVQAIQMVVMAIMMIACIMVMNKMMSGAGKVEAEAAGVAKSAPAAMSATEKAKAAVNDFIKQVENLGDDIEKMLDQMKELPAKVKQACIDAIKAAKQLAKDMGASLTPKSLENDLKTFWDMSALEQTYMGSQIAADVPSIVGGAIQGAQLLRVAQILKEAGEIDAAIQLLEGMIKALEGLLNNLQGGISTQDDFILELQNMYKGLYDNASASYGRVARAELPS